MPFFSVIIPLYNKEKYIKHTLNSVLNQTFEDFEIIIINDGSTDGSLKIVQEFKDARIKIINQKNKGLCYSRNTGIKNALSNFIALLDADDLWMKDYLETNFKLIQAQKKDFVFATNVKLLNSKTNPILNVTNFEEHNINLIENYFSLQKNIMGPSSLVIKKTVFEVVGYFDETINYGEEDDFYIRCFNKYRLVYYNQPKIYYRIGIEEQLTRPNPNFERRIPNYEAYLKIYKNNKDLTKFIDYVYYRMVILYKMELNYELVKFYKAKVNPKNLFLIKRIKFYLPTKAFYFTKKIYVGFLEYLSIY
ncbi:glycosyltransferase family 2 protein [Siansivirga zeaxanthinifaciens]|uniref:Glycosyl transferase n=1 Tax=Siansivirga zeaxanthinifaciens CC-SAMT-1 TaxID=1454006 RepID=A0A0C5W813_9FLAO|nr:glycosyltransferase family A protein [Siansivirga zeaxanthinifaciens]AJR02387.1 glycosyl transferase [Siansivirga zeaxanthinifaciens CC-SAMT-1]